MAGTTELVLTEDQDRNRLLLEWNRFRKCIDIIRMYDTKRLVLSISKPIDSMTMRQLVAIPGMTVDTVTAILDMMEEHAELRDKLPDNTFTDRLNALFAQIQTSPLPPIRVHKFDMRAFLNSIVSRIKESKENTTVCENPNCKCVTKCEHCFCGLEHKENSQDVVTEQSADDKNKDA